jgi:flagellar biosynthetic protein FliP
MRYRGHGWPATLEMAAAMYLPFIALFPPLWLGVLSTDALVLWGHLLMLAAMAAAMLWRLPEYTGHHGSAQVP